MFIETQSGVPWERDTTTVVASMVQVEEHTLAACTAVLMQCNEDMSAALSPMFKLLRLSYLPRAPSDAVQQIEQTLQQLSTGARGALVAARKVIMQFDASTEVEAVDRHSEAVQTVVNALEHAVRTCIRLASFNDASQRHQFLARFFDVVDNLLSVADECSALHNITAVGMEAICSALRRVRALSLQLPWLKGLCSDKVTEAREAFQRSLANSNNRAVSFAFQSRLAQPVKVNQGHLETVLSMLVSTNNRNASARTLNTFAVMLEWLTFAWSHAIDTPHALLQAVSSASQLTLSRREVVLAERDLKAFHVLPKAIRLMESGIRTIRKCIEAEEQAAAEVARRNDDAVSASSSGSHSSLDSLSSPRASDISSDRFSRRTESGHHGVISETQLSPK